MVMSVVVVYCYLWWMNVMLLLLPLLLDLCENNEMKRGMARHAATMEEWWIGEELGRRIVTEKL